MSRCRWFPGKVGETTEIQGENEPTSAFWLGAEMITKSDELLQVFLTAGIAIYGKTITKSVSNEEKISIGIDEVKLENGRIISFEITRKSGKNLVLVGNPHRSFVKSV